MINDISLDDIAALYIETGLNSFDRAEIGCGDAKLQLNTVPEVGKDCCSCSVLWVKRFDSKRKIF